MTNTSRIAIIACHQIELSGSRHHIYLLNSFDMHTVQSTIHTEYKYKSIIVLNAKGKEMRNKWSIAQN